MGQILLEDFRPWLAGRARRRGAPIEPHPRIHEPADGRLGGPARYAASESETQFIADAALDWLGAAPLRVSPLLAAPRRADARAIFSPRQPQRQS